MPSDSDPKDHTYPRIPIVLACSVCSARNYKTTKTTRPGGSALKLKKFCKLCNSHTVHIEGK